MYHCVWPEIAWLPDVTWSNVTWPRFSGIRNRFPRFFLAIVVVQNVPLCNTGSNIATGFYIIKRHVTPEGSLGRLSACTTGLRNIRPIGNFPPEVMSSNVTLPQKLHNIHRDSLRTGSYVIWGDVSHVTWSMFCASATGSRICCLTIVAVQKVLLRMTDMATECDMWPRRYLPWVRCAHAQLEVAQYQP